jgi:DEAD/DEAH box helicase domain-containing protein
MKKFPVVLDVETKYTFREFSDPKKLEVTVAVLYDYKNNSLSSFFKKDLNKLFSILESASYVIGYNINSFDMQVLQAYYPGDVIHFKTFDILDDIRKILGKRLALNDVVYATLGKKKSGHGLQAIELYKEGKLEELKSYCMDDVRLTCELFDYGIRNKNIYYLNENGKTEIKVDWGKYLEEEKGNDMPLTLPF